MTAGLDASDAEAVLAATLELWPPGPDFRRDAARVVRGLVPCSFVMFNRNHLDTGRIDFAVDPPSWQEQVEASADVLVRTSSADHPVVADYLATGVARPVRMSEQFPDAQAWRESSFHREYLAPLGLDWMLIQLVPSADAYLNILALAGCGDDFTERGAAVVAALTPTLSIGCGGGPRADALGGATGGWVLAEVGADGRVRQVTPDVVAPVPSKGARVDDVGRAGLQAAAWGSAVPLVLDGRSWRAQVLTHRGDAVLVFLRAEEGRLHLLTLRQREVLALVAEGCTNRQVATRLDISEGTARKHVEQVLAVLGVAGRAAAAAAWAGRPRV